MQKHKFYDLTEAVETSMKSISYMQEDLRMSDKGELMQAKIQLERTVKDLANEVESLSQSNTQLIENLNTKTFFQKYHDVVEECNQVKLEQEALIDYRFQNFSTTSALKSNKRTYFEDGRQRSKTLVASNHTIHYRGASKLF